MWGANFEKQHIMWEASDWKLAFSSLPNSTARVPSLSWLWQWMYFTPCCFSVLTVNKWKCLFLGRSPKCAHWFCLSSVYRQVGTLPSMKGTQTLAAIGLGRNSQDDFHKYTKQLAYYCPNFAIKQVLLAFCNHYVYFYFAVDTNIENSWSQYS